MICQPNQLLRSLNTPYDDREEGLAAERRAIVVPLDGSAVARRALPRAVELARRWDVPLRLVRVVNPIQPRDQSDLGLLTPTEVRLVEEESDAYLEGVAQAIETANRLAVTTHTLTDVSVDRALREFTTEEAGLVVMARSQRSPLHRWLFGSVANRLVGRLSVPLFVVPVPDDDDAVPPACYRRILVALGAGDAGQSVLEAAAAMSWGGGECHLLHVLAPQAAYATAHRVPGRRRGLPEDAWLHALRAREWLEARDVEVAAHVVDHSHSRYKAILAHAQSLAADLIILGTQHHRVPWWLRGGVAEHVVRRATAPVLLVPSHSRLPVTPQVNHVDFHSH